jgi:DNA adenine methylase
VWVRNNQNKDYVAEAYRSAVRQHTLIQNITYTNLSYDQVDIDDGSIIYCDIPYRGASKYVHLTSTFDFDAFYEWCRETKRTKGAKIFISEYGAPFECVFELQHNVSIATNPFQCTERLYRV